MTREIINTGTIANDGTGDKLRNAFTKVNSNFSELYTVDSAISSHANGAYDLANTLSETISSQEVGTLTLTNTGVTSNLYSGALHIFVHNNYSNTVDYISDTVAITRGANQGLYNPLTDENYDSSSANNGSAGVITNSEWYNGSWGDFSDVTTKTYVNWLESTNNYPPGSLNQEMIMHDIINDKYYAIKFLSWQSSAQGGGFTYTRQLINTETSIKFIKTNYGSEVDYITPNVAITRAENGAIYNPLEEEDWDQDVSPVNTLWNSQGWDDLSDVETRTYATFFSIVPWNIGKSLSYRELVMKDTINNRYYKIKFEFWQGGNNGGGFSYTREEIDLNNPNVGIKFADGSSLKTAKNDRIIPQHISENGNEYYIKREDAGKQIYVKDSYGVYVPTNSQVTFEIGTTIVLISGFDVNLYIYGRDSEVLIHGSGLGISSDTVNFYLPPHSIGTLIKIEENEWILSGAGLTY